MNVVDRNLGERLAEIKNAKIVKSFCYTCPWQCPTEVFVRDGRIVYQKGNPEAPNNIGSRCAKGMASWHVSQDPDRLKYPMRRAGKRGEGRWERISWEEALNTIAERYRHIRDEDGNQAFLVFGGTGNWSSLSTGVRGLYSSFWNRFGGNNAS